MNNIEIYIIVALSVVAAVQFFYWAFFMFRVRRREERTDNQPPVSVIVCAKNEARNLSALVPQLYAQEYPDFRIIVVDDCSVDDTAMVLAELHSRYPELYITTIPGDKKFTHGKKLAVTVGLKAARTEHVVFIDADCLPSSTHWLSEMMSHYTAGREIVIGYGRYAAGRGLLNFVIRYEAFWNAVQYFGFARAWRPFMGVGRNLSYTKSAYEQSSKFRNNIRILSGDDDMFVSEVGTRRNTAVCYRPEGQTVSHPKRTWLDWSIQKTRHYSTASYYPRPISAVLVAEQVTRQLFVWGSIAATVWAPGGVVWIVALSLFVAREIEMYIALALASRNMGERRLWPFAIVMDVLLPWVELAVWIVGTANKPTTRWK